MNAANYLDALRTWMAKKHLPPRLINIISRTYLHLRPIEK